MEYLQSGIYILLLIASINASDSVFDQKLYKDVLDPVVCQEQLDFIGNHPQIRSKLIDVGFRTPQGILHGNLVSLGNYYECLAIKEETGISVLEGKYCTIRAPLIQNNFKVPVEDQQDPWVTWVATILNTTISENIVERILHFNRIKAGLESTMGLYNRESRNVSTEPELMLAVCIPKSCTTRQALESIFFNLTAAGLQYEEAFCRLPYDKIVSGADIAAFVIMVILVFLMIIGTLYEVFTFYSEKKDSGLAYKVFKSFSLYSNTKTLVTCHVKDSSMGFIAGIKTLSVMWAIVAHTHITHFTTLLTNPFYIVEWLTSVSAVWITSYHYVFDTFLLIAGASAVDYMLSRVETKKQLFKQVPVFYLNRFRRYIPILATVILLQASFFNHISDGPYWYNVARNTENCRNNWWLTLFGAQNDANYGSMCLSHSWYLGVEGFLYIISPFVAMGFLEKSEIKRRLPFVCNILIGAILVMSLTYTTDVPSSLFATSRPDRIPDYFDHYYIRGLIRGSPFFVGANVGYLLNVFPRRPEMPKYVVPLLWTLTAIISALLIAVNYPIVQQSWDNDTLDAVVNAHSRYFWIACLCWIIFACARGHGGAANWFLSLKIWKVLGRMSFTMYLIHMPLMNVLHSSALAPVTFYPTSVMCKFLTDYTLTALVAFGIMLLVERPCSALAKCFVRGNEEKQSKLYPRSSNNTDLPLISNDINTQMQDERPTAGR